MYHLELTLLMLHFLPVFNASICIYKLLRISVEPASLTGIQRVALYAIVRRNCEGRY